MNEPIPDATRSLPTQPSTDEKVDPTFSASAQAETVAQEQATMRSQELPSIPGFEIRGILGRGGMGVVYQAWQISLKRHVALKMILAGEHAGPQHLARFQTEAQAVAQLQHPNIVQIYEIGEHQGRPFFCLEYVDGGSLSRKLDHQPQPAETSARLVEVLARAIHYTHQRGIVHRDLKPANILLQTVASDQWPVASQKQEALPSLTTGHWSLTTSPKITDFGLAKQLQDDSGQTLSGAVMGTPSYMAPEQASGKTHEVGPSADVYALGVILHEMLTGRPPFHGDTHVETLRQVIHDEPIPPSRIQPGVPRDLETICLKALAKEPGRRYSSALTLAQDLERFNAGEPILARREGPVRRLWRGIRRRPLTYASLVGGLLAILIASYFAWEIAKTHHIREMTREFNEALKAQDWPAEQVARMEALIADMETVAPEEAADARQNLHQRYADCLMEMARQDPLPPEDKARVETRVEYLVPRAPELAAKIRGELAARDLRSRSALRLTELNRSFESRLKTIEWSADYLDGMERWIAEIEALNAEQAAAARARLYQHYEASIRQALRLDTTLTVADITRVDDALKVLAKRQGPLAKTLTKERDQRAGAMQMIRVVEPPFANAFQVLKVNPQAKAAALRSPFPAAGNPLLLLDDKCQGTVQMEATFAFPSWGKAQQLGLALNTSKDRRRGYTFLLVPGTGAQDPASTELPRDAGKERILTLGEARAEKGRIALIVQRNGVTLRRESLPFDKLEDRSLTLRAERAGSQLTMEVLHGPKVIGTLYFQDVFAVGSSEAGVFALNWPGGVDLEALRLSRQTLPPVRGPLEEADHLLAQGDLENALIQFDRQARTGATPSIQQEARCKKALCLLELKQVDQAAALLSSLVAEEGDRWPVLAACQLWLIYLRQNKRVEADAVADTLLARPTLTPKHLAAVVSDDVRNGLWSFVNEEFSPYNFLLRGDDKRLRSLERILKLHDYLQDNEVQKFHFRWRLVRAYRIAGQNRKAAALLEEWLREPAPDDAFAETRVSFMEELGWVYRELGQPERTLGHIDHVLLNSPAKYRAINRKLFVERARLHAAMGNWPRAEQDLDQYFDAVTNSVNGYLIANDYQSFTAGCLLQGFLRQRRNDKEGAMAAWTRKIVIGSGASRKEVSVTDPLVANGGGIPIIQTLALASLSNRLAEDEARNFQDRLLRDLPPEYRAAIDTFGFRLPAAHLLEMWRAPRGLKNAQHLAFQDTSFPDFLKLPIIVSTTAMMRRDALAAPVTAEQDELIWQLSEDVWAGMRGRKLTQKNMVQLALAWNGNAGLFGWRDLSEALDKQPALRGPLAYVIGHRFLRLKLAPERAADLFRTAQRDAPPDSVLSRLAQQELQRLKVK